MNARRSKRFVAWTLLLCLTGCAGTNVFAPGSTRQQQLNATVHDPYADNDLGPTVEGGRPRDFRKPWAEPVRTRLLRDSWWGVR